MKNVRRFVFTWAALVFAAAAHAQQPATPVQPPVTSTEVFADFESGTYDGWTLEGNCWGTAPASDALFPGKITRFGGKRFVCTLDPKKGNEATGKAVSREFTIEKPFINFKIGGGRYPGQACLNLVVDNAIARTATGNGFAHLNDASWDVSTLIGKKAHFELVDATTSNDHGYVLVDDITFIRRLDHPNYGWRSRTVKPFFVRYSKIWQGVDFSNGETPFPFNMAEDQIQRAIDEVVIQVRQPTLSVENLPSREVEAIGKQITASVNTAVAKLGMSNINKFTRQWLLAEGVCGWVQANLFYNHDLEKEIEGRDWNNFSKQQQGIQSSSVTILSLPKPYSLCWGIAVTTRDIARSVGLHCDLVNGTYRFPGNQVKTVSISQKDCNHSTVCFTFDGGIEVPADVSTAICDYQNNNRPFPNKKTNSWDILPRRVEAWELSLATFNADMGEDATLSFDKQNRHKLLTIPFAEWATRDTEYLKVLLEEYRAWETTRKVSAM